MKDFVSLLVEKALASQDNTREIYKNIWGCDNKYPRQFKPLKFGGEIELSVQASFLHKCQPKLTIDPNKYDCFELGILKNGKLVRLDKVLRLDSSEKLLFEPFLDCDMVVYCNIPKLNITYLCGLLEEEYGYEGE